MENVFQLVLTLASVVVAIALVVALGHLSAIRKLLETLVAQRRMPAQQTRYEVASDQAQPPEEAPAQDPPPIYRPVIVSPPAPVPVQQPRFEEARAQVMPASAPAIVNPPPSPAPAQQTRFEAAEQAPPAEEMTPEGLPAEVGSGWAGSAESPATADLEPPALVAPRTSRLPVIIGIVVLLAAIAFLAFLVIYTK
ncbi:MAG: hypothetical protein ACLPND_20295 [Candidatus Korobacteraceae bacterium]|jgi:hypothetical protein